MAVSWKTGIARSRFTRAPGEVLPWEPERPSSSPPRLLREDVDVHFRNRTRPNLW